MWFTPSNTQNAYNCSGGRNIYGCGTPSGSTVPANFSFLRPQPLVTIRTRTGQTVLRDPGSRSIPFYWWYEQTIPQPNQTYGALADSDLQDYSSLAGAELLIIPGHSEYWTRQARQNVDAFVAAGGNVAILSGNTMWWQVRYADNGDTLVGYRSTADPIANPLLETIPLG